MQNHIVAARRKMPQNVPLVVRRSLQQRQDAVAVRRKHYLFKSHLWPAIRKLQRHALFVARHAANPYSAEYTLLVRRCNRRNVTAASTRDSFPLRVAIDRKHSVVVKKSRKHRRGKFAHRIVRARPDRGRHRKEVKLAEKLREVVFVQKIAKLQLLRIQPLQQPRRNLVKPSDFSKQRVRARFKYVHRLCKISSQPATRILIPG